MAYQNHHASLVDLLDKLVNKDDGNRRTGAVDDNNPSTEEHCLACEYSSRNRQKTCVF